MSNATIAVLAAPFLFSLLAPAALSQGAGTPVYYPGTGHYYEVVQTTMPWDQAKQTAESMSYLGVAGHLVTYDDLAEDQFVYSTLSGGPLGNSWIGLYQDFGDAGYSEPLGGWKWVTGEPLTYSNWTNGEPNDGGNAEHYGGYWPSNKWNDYQLSDAAASRFVVEYDTPAAVPLCYGDGSGTICPCGNSAAAGTGCGNSTGVGASLFTSGTSSLSQFDLMFHGAGLIPNQSTILFQGNSALSNGNGLLFGDGLRCVGVNVRRLGILPADGAGAATWFPALFGNPNWSPGDVRRFQIWYSDPFGSPCGAGFNLSNAVEIQFQL